MGFHFFAIVTALAAVGLLVLGKVFSLIGFTILIVEAVFIFVWYILDKNHDQKPPTRPNL